MGRLLRFAMDAGPYPGVCHSHPPSPAHAFSPAHPPIALQSFTRDVRFAQRRLRSSIRRWMVTSLRLAGDAWPLSLWSQGDGETQCLKVRSDNVWDGPSLRSQAGIRTCAVIHRLSRRVPHRLYITFFYSPACLRAKLTGGNRIRRNPHLYAIPLHHNGFDGCDSPVVHWRGFRSRHIYVFRPAGQ